jgi:putative ABC transport system permease protein
VSLLRLAWKNVVGDRFRSLAILCSAALVAGLALTATFVVRGAETSLRWNLQRLGADILILPWGTMTEKIGGIRLMSAAIDGWMPKAYIDKIAGLDGVAAVSPQLHLATLRDSPYCRLPEMFLVGFDPGTDFVLEPWLEEGGAKGLAKGKAIAGAQIVVPDGGDRLTVLGYELELGGRLAQTATSMDQTVFVSLETAQDMVDHARGKQSKEALKIVPGSISAMMVKVGLGSEPHDVAVHILESVPGVVPLETPDLFQAERRQMIGVLRTLLGVLGIIWALAVTFMGLVFSIVVNDRRRDIGVLRAVGFPSRLILKSLLVEGAILALVGGSVGVASAYLGLANLGEQVERLARLPLQFPSGVELISLSLGGQALALASVTLAAFIPAWRISHEEVAVTMRE